MQLTLCTLGRWRAGALRELTQLLLVLLDGITLPGDLLPGPLPAAATGAGGQLQRRGLRQLQQLAKAHEGAAPSSSVPAGGGAAAPAAGRPAAAKTDTAKPLGKPLAAGASTAGRPGTAGKAAAAAVATAGDVAPEPSLLPRPYALATWQLPACPKELHVLGWSAEDSAAVAAAAALEASAGEAGRIQWRSCHRNAAQQVHACMYVIPHMVLQ